MPFPILLTPFVVLSEIISLLEPNEIVSASFCSKNLKLLLKRHYQREKPLEWRLWMIDHSCWGQVGIVTSEGCKPITVLLANPISEFKGHKSEEHTDGYERAFAYKCPVLYFNNQVLGSKWIVDYVTGLFGLDVYGLTIDRNGTWAINWIDNRQEKMLECFSLEKMQYNSNADKTVDYVLRNARVSQYCNIDGNVSNGFKFDGKVGPMRQLWIRSNGHWVTLNNLIHFDCRYICIQGSRLSVSDLNSFLRHWRAGGSPRLEWLHLNFEKHTFIEIFDEDLEVVETNEVRRYRLVANDREFVIEGGYSIRRMDGVKATIKCNFGWFRMVVWHETAKENGV